MAQKRRLHKSKIIVDIDVSEKMAVVRNFYSNEKYINNWMHLNSSHVFDAAFFILGGIPNIKCLEKFNSKNGEKVFCGIADMQNSSLLNFRAHWGSKSNWKLNVLGDNFFASSQNIETSIVYDNDSKFEKLAKGNQDDDKPGMAAMIECFLRDSEDLPTLMENLALHEFIHTINEQFE